jgi:hypothetical protein
MASLAAMASAPTSLSTGLLLLACAALGGVIALEASEEFSFAPEVTAAAPALPDPPAPERTDYVPPPESDFEIIAERPLFSPSRRPFVPAVALAPEAGPEAEAVAEPLLAELIGVVLTGAQRSVLIQEEGRPLRRVHLGQSLEGWRIEEVERDHVTLRRGDETHILEMRRD